MTFLNSRSPDFVPGYITSRQNSIDERDVCFLSTCLGLQDIPRTVEWLQEREGFIDFLSGVLNLDPARRWTPRQVNPGGTHTTCDARDMPHVILNRHLLPASLSIHPPSLSPYRLTMPYNVCSSCTRILHRSRPPLPPLLPTHLSTRRDVSMSTCPTTHLDFLERKKA